MIHSLVPIAGSTYPTTPLTLPAERNSEDGCRLIGKPEERSCSLRFWARQDTRRESSIFHLATVCESKIYVITA